MVAILKPSKEDVQNYWQFILQNPANQNPLSDHDGTLCLQVQNPSSGLLYLCGNCGGYDLRNIPIPIAPDQPIFVAVNPVIITEPEAGGPNADLKKLANDDEDSASKALLTINDEVHDLIALNYRVETDPFDVTVPDNGIFSYPPGHWKAVADGYYAIIPELPPGDNNKIEIDAVVDKPADQEDPWESKVNYNFKVK
jgi:hypothetical protein